MAMTRKFLKAMGIEEEKIEQIIDAHTETVNALKEERDNFKADAEKLPSVQKELNELKEATKNGGEETVLKSEYDKIKKEYDDYKADISEKETKSAKEHAYRELLKAAGISEKRIDAVLKVSNIDSIELDKDGKIKDADDRTKSIKEEWADFIETTSVKGANTTNPPANGGKGTGKTKDEILSIKDGAERRKEMAENKHLFPELAGE